MDTLKLCKASVLYSALSLRRCDFADECAVLVAHHQNRKALHVIEFISAQ
jgi:hypothetical protein